MSKFMWERVAAGENDTVSEDQFETSVASSMHTAEFAEQSTHALNRGGSNISALGMLT